MRGGTQVVEHPRAEKDQQYGDRARLANNRIGVPACGERSASVEVGPRRFVRARLGSSRNDVPARRREDDFDGGWAPPEEDKLSGPRGMPDQTTTAL